MKKIVTVAVLAGGALALAACGAKKEEAPAEPAETEMMAPAEETPAATDDAAAAAEDLDPTGNPIGMDKPAAADAMPAEGEAPAAE
jgi:hypothetical protein